MFVFLINIYIDINFHLAVLLLGVQRKLWKNTAAHKHYTHFICKFSYIFLQQHHSSTIILYLFNKSLRETNVLTTCWLRHGDYFTSSMSFLQKFYDHSWSCITGPPVGWNYGWIEHMHVRLLWCTQSLIISICEFDIERKKNKRKKERKKKNEIN